MEDFDAMVKQRQRDMRKSSSKARIEQKIVDTSRDLAARMVPSHPDMVSEPSIDSRPPDYEVDASDVISNLSKEAPKFFIQENQPKALIKTVKTVNFIENRRRMTL